jgi:hypothetical protein
MTSSRSTRTTTTVSESQLVDLSSACLSAVVNHWSDFTDVDYPNKAALPDRQFVYTGLPPADCEQLSVTVERTFGSEGSPAQERIIPIGDGVPWLRVLVASIQIIRCCSTIDAQGDEPAFPADTTMTAESLVILTDADLVLQCLIAAQAADQLAGCGGIALENWKAVAAQGGLSGGLTRVRLATF